MPTSAGTATFLEDFHLSLQCEPQGVRQPRQTTDHLIFKCNKLSKQRKEMIKEIQNTGGTWPPTHEISVNDYLQLFVKFIKSINLAICNDTQI